MWWRGYAGKCGATSEQARALLSNMDLDARRDAGSIWSNWQDVTQREKADCVRYTERGGIRRKPQHRPGRRTGLECYLPVLPSGFCAAVWTALASVVSEVFEPLTLLLSP